MDEDLPSMEGFVSLTNDRGVLKKIIKRGEVPFLPSMRERILVHYTGWYHGGEHHGEVFDDSWARNKPLETFIGLCLDKNTIRAFDVVLSTMEMGEICEVIAFPDYAYADGQVRKYKIERLLFEDWPSSFRGTSCFEIRTGPNIHLESGDKVKIHVTAYTKTDFLQDDDIEFILGDYENVGIPMGVNDAVERHGPGWEFYIWVDIEDTFTSKQCQKRHIPENTIVYYYVNVMSVETRERIDPKMPFADRWKFVQERKKEANEYFKNGNCCLAYSLYRTINRSLLFKCDEDPERSKQWDELRVNIDTNRALAALRMGLPNKCLSICDHVLQDNPMNEKALFRKALSLYMLEKYWDAKQILLKIIQMNPTNNEAVEKMITCDNKMTNSKIAHSSWLEPGLKSLGDQSS